jgi:hypothetical protein
MKGSRRKITLFILFAVIFLQGFFSPLPVQAAEIDEVDGFQNPPNYRWENLTTTSAGIDEHMEGDHLFINNTNSSGTPQNYTKARRLNDRDMYFNSRFLLDVGGEFDGSDMWLDELSDLADFNEDLDTWSGTGLTQSGSYYDGAAVFSGTQALYTMTTSHNPTDAAIHHYFQMEFQVISSGAEINGITVENTDSDVYYSDSTVRGNGVNEVLRFDLDTTGFWADGADMRIDFNTDITSITIAVNYTFVSNFADWNPSNNTRGDYNPDEGFKFFLANEQNATTLEWEFTSDSSLNTSINNSLRVAIFDQDGNKALDSNNLFAYNYTQHGWLTFEVEWNVDTKRIRSRLTDSTERRIFDWNSLEDMYNVSQLITTFDYAWSYGKPKLGFNATLPDSSYLWVVIDYIDANYDLMDWRTASGENIGWSGSNPSGDESQWDTAAQWSAISIFKSFDGTYSGLLKYYHVIDHFDAVSFNVGMNVTGLDTNDQADFWVSVFNVKHNGSLERIVSVQLELDNNGGLMRSRVFVYGVDSGGAFDYANEGYTKTFGVSEDIQLALELFYDDEDALIFQSRTQSNDGILDATIKSEPLNSSEPYTQEMVVVMEYLLETDNSLATDDEVFILVSEYDVVRKGILGDILSGFLGLIFNVVGNILTILLTPVIIAFMFVGGLIVNALITLGKFLEPFFGVISSAVTSLIGFLVSIVDAIVEIGIDVGNFLLGLIGQFIDDTFSWLATIIDVIVTLAVNLIFWAYDNLIPWPGQPLDLIALFNEALGYIVAFGAWLISTAISLTQWFIDVSWVILVVWWAWAVLISFGKADFEPAEGIGNFIEAWFTPIIQVPIISLPIPQGLFFTLWLVLIMPGDFALWGALP